MADKSETAFPASLAARRVHVTGCVSFLLPL